MQKWKCELKRKTRDGDRKRDFKVRGKIIIPSGGGATGHSVQRWCQQPIYSPPGLTACPHKLISHHLTCLCSIFFLESGVSQKLSVLKHPVSASSQTPPVMMWALLPGVSQSNPISSTSKPHPCEELCLEKTCSPLRYLNLRWRSNKANALYFGREQASTGTLSGFPPTTPSRSVS